MPMKDILLTFLVAMVPVVELRGAIPFGVVQIGRASCRERVFPLV